MKLYEALYDHCKQVFNEKKSGEFVNQAQISFTKGSLFGFESGVKHTKEEYEEKLRWISIEERLPENRERVLIKVLRSDKSTYIVTGSVVLDSKLGIYWQSGHATQLNVTHWLSLSFL